MMKKFLFLCMFCLLPISAAQAEDDDLVYVRIDTSMGIIDLALNRSKALITVDNFLAYAEEGYYSRLIFHRVVPGRLIQGGGYTKRLYERARRDPILNEADNGLKNIRGSIAMARNQDPQSAQSQFYINIQDNPELDHKSKDYILDWGYAVFGQVINGMGVVEVISAVPSEAQGQFEKDVPIEPVFINAVTIIGMDELEASE